MAEKDRLQNVFEDLKSPNIKRKIKAINALGEINTKQSQTTLLKALSDDSWHIRNAAAYAIAKLGNKIFEDIAKLMQDGVWFVRSSAAIVFGELGEIGAIPFLIPYFDDSNATLRNNVREALRKIIQKNSVEFKESFLPTQPEEIKEKLSRIIKELLPDFYQEVENREEKYEKAN